MNLIGQKPFWGMSHHERCLHVGFASYWYSGEWFDFAGDDDTRELLLEASPLSATTILIPVP
ncbi:hypothetical protein [Rhizobium leguminosarum]|uniref:hypothetical protein n=1 Tax=Rhizobium leguminosarum TaxID=384 RepID=UPI001C952DC3|nr:hypothetical protein [Rhizobium leguminosarum]